MNPVMLQGMNVTKYFGGLVALNHIDFEVQQGSIVGLIGPNGSGKTTLFNLVSGIFRPEQGTIRFKGTEITRLKPYLIARLGIARTFQIVRPLKELSVVDNVAAGILYGTRIDGMAEARERAVDLLRFTDLHAKKDTPAGLLKLADRKRLEVTRLSRSALNSFSWTKFSQVLMERRSTTRSSLSSASGKRWE